jgi:peptidoglycan/LPS O-acetylase OafA/YrhL
MPRNPASLSSKILPVDGLRGIAILLVQAFHLFQLDRTAATSSLEYAAFSLNGSGWIGVDLFFVLSGFLITGILLDSKGSPAYYRNFWIRRALRILPLYFLFLAFAFALLPRLDPAWAGKRETFSPWWYAGFLSNVLYGIRGEWISGILDPTWSLSIEEQFYWIWPFAVAVLSRKSLKNLCVFLILFSLGLRCAIVWGEPSGIARLNAYVFTLCRLDALAAGGLIAILWRTEKGLSGYQGVAKAGAFVLGPLLCALLVYCGGDFNHPLVLCVGFSAGLTLFSCWLILALGSPGKFLVFPPLLLLGRYSYCLYLAHIPVRNLVKSLAFNPDATQLMGSRNLSYLTLAAIAFAVTLVAAHLSYHLFEKRILALKDKLAPHSRAGDGDTSRSEAA